MAYLRFRLRVIANAYVFIHVLKCFVADKDQHRLTKVRLALTVDEIGKPKDFSERKKLDDREKCEAIWFFLMSVALWFNLATTPSIMVFPELNAYYFNFLWLSEFLWLLDIARKLLLQHKPGMDSFEAAVNYMKSTLILDVMSTLPQVASGMNPTFAIFKNIRIYQIWLLHFPYEFTIRTCYTKKDKHEIWVMVYAVSTFCQIMILLHYLGNCFVFVGSDYFADTEPGRLPWTMANEDFHGMSNMGLIIFANYWVCTVITTVGYGDYTGSTTLEYYFTICVAFFGFVIFSVLQIAVL